MRTHLLVAIVTCACDGDPPHDTGPDRRYPVVSLRATPDRDLDLLFVVDNSGSMVDKQDRLAASIPQLVAALDAPEGGRPNLHIGVVSTDMGTKGVNGAPGASIGTIGQGGCGGTGDNGALQVSGAPVTGTFVTDIAQPDGTRRTNYTGDLASVMSQMVKLGGIGCGFEQPLHAMLAALRNTDVNAGFLRPDALLAIVFLADEDDCTPRDATVFQPTSATLGPFASFRCTRFGVACAVGGQTADQMNVVGAKSECTAATGSTIMADVAPFVDGVTNLKADPSKIVVGGIVGPTAPFAVEQRTVGGELVTALARSCMYSTPTGTHVADPGVRLRTFIRQFSVNTLHSICELELSLLELGELVTSNVGSPCLDARLRDVDDKTPGLQPDCIVEDVVGSDVAVIPACGSPPCWRLEVDADRCPLHDMLKLVVERDTAPDPETVTRMRCRIMQ